MPVKGLNKKAKPKDVCTAYLAACPELRVYPKPCKSETFAQFLLRLDGSQDCFLRLLIEEGYGEPSQREYLDRLKQIAEELYQLRLHLGDAWRAI